MSGFRLRKTGLTETPDLLSSATGLTVRILVLLAACAGVMLAARNVQLMFSDVILSSYFAYYQDLPVALAMVVALVALAHLPFPRTEIRISPAIVAAVVFVLCYAGTYVLFGKFDLAMDEVMANFDARIFRRGELLAGLSPEWRPIVHSFQPIFLVDVPGNVAWASSYLPGNAAIRALFGRIGDAALAGPTLAAVSVLLLHDIARKLRPGDGAFATVSLLLFATSCQFLFMAMTSFAMSAHLAFNLAWLWLALDDRRWSRAGAVLVSFAACGLHQTIFHPLFVLPFLPWLWCEGRKPQALLYGGVILASALFWLSYWPLLLHVLLPAASAGTPAAIPLADRLSELVLDSFQLFSLVVTLDNLLRFLTWQNLLVLPLAIAAAMTLRRQPPIAWSLAGGIALTFLAMVLLMPHQGLGWGYRYLHGLLGNFALLAGFGWQAIAAASPDQTGRLWSALKGALLVSVGLLLPFRAAQVHAFAEPLRKADSMIAKVDSDIVILDYSGRWRGRDLLRNDPYLQTRPIRIRAEGLPLDQARRLCARYRVVLLDRFSPELAPLRAVTTNAGLEAADARVEALRGVGCGVGADGAEGKEVR